MKTTSHLLLLLAIIFCPLTLTAEEYTMSSPDGKLEATILLNDGELSYHLQKDGKIIVRNSPLGLTTSTTDFAHKLTCKSHRMSTREETYTLPAGKQSICKDHCQQLELTLQNPEAWEFSLEFRLYNDGFGFRYMIPTQKGAQEMEVTGEASRICINDFESCLACRYIGNAHSPNYCYEGFYKRYAWDELTEGDSRTNAPTLVETKDGYVLLSEANSISNYSAALIKAEADKGEFSFSYGDTKAEYKEDNGQHVHCTLPLSTPWRMAIVGDLSTVFESTLTENLCPSSEMHDTSWIHPGRAAWFWGGSDGNTPSTRASYGGWEEAEKAYIDLAAEMGWEYTLVDGGWSRKWIESMVEYAHSKGIRVLLWQTATLSDSKEFSNENMEATLAEWKKWGIDGIKIDFWEDDANETVSRMEKLLKTAARYKMLVNFHGCTRPSGLRRTYPFLMTQEGVYGGEQNFWNYHKVTPEHHINLMFTRNVVGGMDFTPGDFARHDGQLLTNASMAHRLGLTVAYESGIVHFAESPDNLKYFYGKDILKRIPSTWDETRLLEGALQQYATIARRHGEDWWVAGATVEERDCELKFDFLESGKEYTAYIYSDGSCRTDMAFRKQKVTSKSIINLHEMSAGGFLVQISLNDNLPTPSEVQTYEAESKKNSFSPGLTLHPFDTTHASGGQQVHDLGLGRKLEFKNIKVKKDGLYVVTIYYSSVENRQGEIFVNGKSLGIQQFFGNGILTNTYGPEGMTWKHILVSLKAHKKNTIAIQAEKDGWAPNIDRITIQQLNTPEK